MNLKERFARTVRTMRHEQGLTQDDLADAASLSRNYVGMIERVETTPTLDAVEAILEALGVDTSAIFELPCEETAEDR
ncbi:MAG: helix-turn-helix transcriptional regulator [Litorimonas sp.]